jgi:hypothetical protein
MPACPSAGGSCTAPTTEPSQLISPLLAQDVLLAHVVLEVTARLDAEEPWQRDALCNEPAYRDTEFFPERGVSSRATKAVCGRCLVRDECLDYALRAGVKHGIWGGLSERERRRVRSDRVFAA